MKKKKVIVRRVLSAILAVALASSSSVFSGGLPLSAKAAECAVGSENAGSELQQEGILELSENGNIVSGIGNEILKKRTLKGEVHSGTDGKLDWSIDENGLLAISGTGDYDSNGPKWRDYASEIKEAKLNITGITNMSHMFEGCSELKTLDLTGLDTSAVTDMRDMFAGCSGLTTLNLSGFDTSNVTTMLSMFYKCSGLTTLDLSNFNTSNVKDMASMFQGCSSLTTLNLSNFDNSNVKDISCAFWGCSGLTTLDLSKFNTSRVINMTSLFSGCSGLTELDLSNFDTSSVAYMKFILTGCDNLKKVVAPANTKMPIALPKSDSSNWRNGNGEACTEIAANWTEPMTYTREMVQTLKPGTTLEQDNITYKVTEPGSAAVTDVQDGQIDKKLVIPDTVMVNGQECVVDTISAKAFSENKRIEQVTLGKNIKTIEKAAFSKCKNLKQVTFDDKLGTIAKESFLECTSLKKIVLPDSIKTIGAKAFMNCKSVKTIKIGKKAAKVKSGAIAVPHIGIAKTGAVTVETVPMFSAGKSPALIIGNYAFAACVNAKKVIINSAVRVIGSSAFRGCKKLSDIIVKSQILEKVRRMALKEIHHCTITVPSNKFKKYRILFRNKGQGKKVLIAKA